MPNYSLNEDRFRKDKQPPSYIPDWQMRPLITDSELKMYMEREKREKRRKIYGLIANSLVIIAILTLVYMCCTHQPQQ